MSREQAPLEISRSFFQALRSCKCWPENARNLFQYVPAEPCAPPQKRVCIMQSLCNLYMRTRLMSSPHRHTTCFLKPRFRSAPPRSRYKRSPSRGSSWASEWFMIDYCTRLACTLYFPIARDKLAPVPNLACQRLERQVSQYRAMLNAEPWPSAGAMLLFFSSRQPTHAHTCKYTTACAIATDRVQGGSERVIAGS